MRKRRGNSPFTGRPGPELIAIRSFWKLLGWPELRFERRKITHVPVPPKCNPFVTWYESGDLDDLYLMIHNSPVWCAAVYAIRYRIFSCWHEFKLSSSPSVQAKQAKRLSPLLERRWFADRHSRREYRTVHPHCGGWSWRRIRESGSHFGLTQR
jgi:hypothetical protein